MHGRLLAIGEEGDSIYFYSPEAGFGGIDNEDTPRTEIRLEYCVVDSAFGRIKSELGKIILTNNRIHSSNIYIVRTTTNIDTIKYCNFYANENSYGVYIELDHGGPSVFQYNNAPNVSLETLYEQIAPIHDNHMQGIFVFSQPFTEINNNDLGYQYYLGAGRADECNTYWHDNHLMGTLGFYGGGLLIPQILVERNTINGSSVNIDRCQGTIQNNIIDGRLEIWNSQITSLKNLVISPNDGIQIVSTGSNIIQGNTIVFNSYGVYANGVSGINQVVNNIFLGDGVNCTGIYSTSPSDFIIRFNDFHQVTSATYNCQLDTGNIFLDPCFRAGNPYDYQLQANSPCIDAGDPISPLDPDGTQADMGCYFFDHRIDNPPAIISPVVVNVQRGTTLRYIARATDDFGPLGFGFWNLPPWLYRVPDLMDFEQKYAVVQGRVPQGQPNFTFGVWVQDGSSQRDYQEVSVLISPYTILQGNVTGVLTLENSPYLVVQDVVVPIGDSLTIEPGVEILFQWDPIMDLRHQIIVRGKLLATGTPEDTIRFVPELGDSVGPAWRGIWCEGASSDTIHFKYIYLWYGHYGIVADSQRIVCIDHAHIEDTWNGVISLNNSSVLVDSCHFLRSEIKSYGSSVNLTNSNFGLPDSSAGESHFNFNLSSRGVVTGCTFYGGYGCIADSSTQLEFIGNRILRTSAGIQYENGSSGIAANNIFIGGRGLWISAGDSVLVNNNLFYNMDLGINITLIPEETFIKNNIFLANDIGLETSSYYPPFANISYNAFFDNDSNFVNCIPDSTNIYLDPMVQDTIDFRLSLGSPCIDAGDPEPFFNDVDSTRNDIGCWGGPWGESYPYTPVLSQQTKPLPTEFALLPPYPNPFNSVLVIPFTVPIQKEVMITIYNILGQKVQEFTFPSLSPGVHRVVWNSGPCASGLYIIHFISGGKELNQKALLLR